MTEYKEFKYQYHKANLWILRYPSGFKTYIEAESETEVKQKIDAIIAMFA